MTQRNGLLTQTDAIKEILFIELLGGLGDVVIALPAIQAIAHTYPQANVTVLTFSPGSELLHTHPLITRVIPVQKGKARPSVEQLLKAPPTQNSQPQYDLIVTDTAYEGIDTLVQNSGAKATVTDLWRSPPIDEKVSDRFLNILQQENIISPQAAAQHRRPILYPSPIAKRSVEQHLSQHTSPNSTPHICLLTDAGMPIKRWASQNFVELGQLLQAQYNATLWVPISGDIQKARAIVTQINNARIWPSGPLDIFIAFLARMDCAIANDTGPAHIAAALNTPTLTLFGPSHQGRYGQPPPHINLQAYPTCPQRRINFTQQTCWYSNQCPYPWRTCTNLITPHRALEKITTLLQPLYPLHTTTPSTK